MAEAPRKPKPEPPPAKPFPSPSPSTPAPPTPAPASPRRSRRLLSLDSTDQSPRKPVTDADEGPGDRSPRPRPTKRSTRSAPRASGSPPESPSFSPASPDLPEPKRRRRRTAETERQVKRAERKRVFYKKVVYDGGEFEVGDDVYVKRREDADSDADDPDVEECRMCFKSGKSLMIECDDCLGGFHLRCLKPPLKKVPDGDWMCAFCEARKMGRSVSTPKPPEGRKIRRTAKEKLLSSDLWAARIEW